MKKILTKKLALGIIIIFLFAWWYLHNAANTSQMAQTEQGIVLSSEDIALVKKENFFVKAPISGELYPLEQTTIIAKVGAETQSVYVREGQAVKKNQVLAQLNTADLKQALVDKEAALTAAKASYQFSLTTLSRYKKLLEKKYYSQNDYDSAIHQLRLNEAGVEQAKAALNEAKLQLSYAKITSSLKGIVSERNLEPGMNVSVGQTLFKVVNLDHLEWRAMVPADEIAQVKENQTATFNVEGFEETFSGKVARLNPSTVAGTRAYYAYIIVDNLTHTLKNGMFATGSITLNQRVNSLVIPFEAVKHEKDGRAYVYKVDAHHHIQKRWITLGLSDPLNNKSEILSGVKAGEWVIASSAEVQPGSLVILPASFSDK